MLYMDFEYSPKQLMDEAHNLMKEFDNEIMKDLNEEQIEMINAAKIENPKWFSLNTEQAETVKKIAAEYPYSIELVSGVFTEQKFSEEKTREILMKRLVKGW